MEEGEESETSHYRGVNPTTTSSSLHEGNNISTVAESSSFTSLPEAAVFQISDHQSCFNSGTYIVQVPRDQVYRIPPRENATLLQNYRRGERAKSSSSSILLFVVIIVLFIGAVLGSLLVIFLIYNNPSFSIEHFLVKQRKTNKQNYIEYDIRMKIHNPNKYVLISYQSNSNVILSSSFSSKKKIELGSGKFPKLRQGSKDSSIVNVTVHGSRSQLPKEIAAHMRMRSKTKISLLLSMNVPVKFKVGTLNVKSKKIHVSCSFFVDRFNYKDARVVTQQCTTRG